MHWICLNAQALIPADMPAHLLTHICYAFANVHEDGRLHLESDDDSINLGELTTLKEKNPQLRVLHKREYSSNFDNIRIWAKRK